MSETQVKAYAAQAAKGELGPYEIQRRKLREDDVAIAIDYCGVCHTDVHYVDNDWGNTRFPIVPGHEIVGRVTAVGSAVTQYKAGDRVGVGCMIDSCRNCTACDAGLEQYCEHGMTLTYNSRDRHDKTINRGGYSTDIVASERFVVKIPVELDPAAAAPLLCAGITTYSPLKHYGVKAGQKVGVVGMGGLGHMGIKFAKAMGATVTLFTRSANKQAEALRNGADEVVISTDEKAMKAAAGQLDFILDTAPVAHDLNPYLNTLKYDGVYILVGLLEPLDPPVEGRLLLGKRRVLAGSLIGGMPETQEVLDFCAEHQISCDIELIKMAEINNAYERMKRGDIKYRFVIDINSLRD